MIRIAIVGIGKMGLSHLSMLKAHPDVEVAAVCDQAGYVLDVLHKYTGVGIYKDYQTMLDRLALDAVVIATPTAFHFPMVRAALEKGLSVFCEKPLCLRAAESEELAALAEERQVVTQVGYHNRFVGAFREVRKLLDAGAIGDVSHALAEAYGPVVLKPKGSTWRSKRSTGGGCLYDYAAHPIDLLRWYLGEPETARGTTLGRIFSTETEDEVLSSLAFNGSTNAQLSVNWSDESHRKMTTKVSLWGKTGRIVADRQECQVYLSENAAIPEGYNRGWNVRYTTDLTEPVWFYLRGEEYSAQLDYFVRQVGSTMAGNSVAPINGFSSAAGTDRVIEMLINDAAGLPQRSMADSVRSGPQEKHRRWRRRSSTGESPAPVGAEAREVRSL